MRKLSAIKSCNENGIVEKWIEKNKIHPETSVLYFINYNHYEGSGVMIQTNRATTATVAAYYKIVSNNNNYFLIFEYGGKLNIYEFTINVDGTRITLFNLLNQELAEYLRMP